jgi:uncharacterized membrane protein
MNHLNLLFTSLKIGLEDAVEPSQQIVDLENRVLKLEKMLGVAAASAPPLSPPPAPAPVADLRKGGHPKNLSLLGTAGIVCIFLAAIYLIKLSIDAGWLTPVRQVALATSLGIGLIVAGFRIKTADREYLSYLPGAGIAVLFLTALGGSLYHHLYGPTAALLFVGTIAATAIRIYDRLRLFGYLILSQTGAYLAPFVFANPSSTELIQVYFLVVSTAYSVIAVMLDARPIAIFAAYFALFASSVVGTIDADHSREAALYVLCQGLIFIGGTIYHTIATKRPLKAEEAARLFPLLLFFYGIEYALVNKVFPGEAPFFSIAFAVVLFGIYGFLKARLPKEAVIASGDVLMASAFLVLTHSLYLVLLPSAYQPLTFMVLLLIAAYFYHETHLPEVGSYFRKTLRAVGAGLLVWNFVVVLVSLVNKDDALWTTTGFFMSGGLLALLKLSPWMKEDQAKLSWLLYAPHLMMATSLYALFKETGSTAVSAAWALYALAILGYALKKQDRAIARSSMVLLILSSLKVFIHDLSGANTLARVLSLLVTGALLYTAGWVLRKIPNHGDTSTSTKQPQPTTSAK